ncbi:MAG: ROK family transcriptional regulator [Propionibacterium sp.]|nr:ROK family transcriptional regulator [Propionibacterium sp.]
MPSTRVRYAHSRPGVSQPLLRQTNLRLVVASIYAADEPVSRARVAQQTGLTRSTVSRLVDELITGGFVDELDPLAAGRGRPAVPLRPAAHTLVALGLEVNVEHLCARVVDLSGNMVAEEWLPMRDVARDPATVLGMLGDAGRRCLAEVQEQNMRPVSVVIGLPGLVDRASDSVLWAPNLDWSDVRISDLIGDLGGLTPVLGNEADLAAYTVASPMPGKPSELQDFLYVSSEVGIGAALVRDGRVLSGENGWGGELGHIMVNPNGPVCVCGSTGCLEQYAGRHALLRAAGLPTTAALDDLLATLDDRDKAALAAVQQAGTSLGRVLASTINLLDVGTVVLGGDLVAIADHLLPVIEHELRAHVLTARWRTPQVQTVWFDPAPVATGATIFGLRQVLAEPARWL